MTAFCDATQEQLDSLGWLGWLQAVVHKTQVQEAIQDARAERDDHLAASLDVVTGLVCRRNRMEHCQ